MAEVAKKVKHKVFKHRALERYRSFWTAIEEAGEAVEMARRLAAKVEESKRKSWAAPAPDEVRAAGTKAARALQMVAKSLKRWEAELVSRDWV